MPISETARIAALAGALAALGGCATSLGGPPDSVTLPVAGRSVTVAGPPGFCIDAQSTTTGAPGAFVLLADCALLGGTPIDTPPVGAVLTASVASAPAGEGDAPTLTLVRLARYLETPTGRALLGRSGEGVRVLASRNRGEVLYLFVEDRGPQPVAGIDPRFWRAFLDIEDRLVVLSLLAFEDGGIDPQQALDLVVRFADATGRANAAP